MSLLARLFVLVILVLLPSLAVQIYNELDARKLRAREGQEQALRTVHLIADEQSRVFSNAGQLLISLGRIAATPGSNAWCDALFAQLGRAYPQYSRLASYDLGGRLTCSAQPPSARPDDAPADLLRLARTTDNLVTSGYDATTQPPAMLLGQSFRDEDGHVAGVIVAGLDLHWLNREIAEKSLPPNSTVSIVDRNGVVVARHPGAERFVGHAIPGGRHAYMLDGGEGVQEALGFEGISRIYAYTPLPGGPAGLVVSVGLEKGQILKGAEAANMRGLLVIPAQAVLGIVLGIIGARWFLRRPIRRLLIAADQLRRGELQQCVGFAEDRSEFGRLGAAFDMMAKAVAAREEELERRVAERTRDLQAEMRARQQAEAALHQAQKMEAVGRLTGGIAHDFNNLLAVVIGNIELALGRVGNWEPVAARLGAALASAQRGAILTQHLLSFARKQTLRPEILDVNDYIRSMLDMLRRLLRSDISVQAELTEDAWPVRVDPGQLEAAILNLTVNSRDAMPNGGQLVIETENRTLPAEAGSDRPGGDFVAVTIRDTGVGIPEELLDKVFEPFFTTKEVGAGSGLGLSMVHGFARQSAGAVGLVSTPGLGTAVTLYLPRSRARPSLPARLSATPLFGEGRVMLVDDNEDVRRVLADMLTQSGFIVTSARNGAEALTIARQADAALAVAVIDVVLPDGMNGLQVAESVRRVRPEIGLILITGHLDSVGGDELPADTLVLTKPFTSANLVAAVTSVSPFTRNRPQGMPISV